MFEAGADLENFGTIPKATTTWQVPKTLRASGRDPGTRIGQASRILTIEKHICFAVGPCFACLGDTVTLGPYGDGSARRGIGLLPSLWSSAALLVRLPLATGDSGLQCCRVVKVHGSM